MTINRIYGMNVIDKPVNQLAKRVDQSIQYFFQSLLWLIVILIFTNGGLFFTISAYVIVLVAAFVVLGEDNGIILENKSTEELLHKVIKIRKITVISTVTAIGVIIFGQPHSSYIMGFVILILLTIVSQYHFSMKDIEISKI